MGRLRVWARPGSARDELDWDPWRHRWVIACRQEAVRGEANDALVALLSGWLGVGRERIRWVVGERSRAKSLEVDGLTDAEIAERLEVALGRPKA